jgi:hypothetical protein
VNDSPATVETEGPPHAWRSLRLIAVIGGLALLALLVGRTCFNTQGRVLVKARAPNCVEIYVVQTFTKDGDLYNMSFNCRRPDGVWGWGYVNHEDGFWPASRARATLDTNRQQVIVERAGKPFLLYDWGRDEFVLHRFGMRTNSGSDLWDPTRTAPGWWSPEMLPVLQK